MFVNNNKMTIYAKRQKKKKSKKAKQASEPDSDMTHMLDYQSI